MTLTFWVTGFVFVVVNLFMAYCVWRYRQRKGACRALRTRKQEARGRAHLATTVGVAAMLAPGLLAWAKFVDVPKDAIGVRGRRQAMELQLSLPRRGRRARHRRRALRERREPVRHQSRRPERQGRHPDHEPRSCISPSASRSRRSCARSTSCTISRPAVPRQDEHGAGTRDLRLVHADAGTGISTCSASNCAASRISRCAARWSSRRSPRSQAWLASYPTFAQTMARTPGDAAAGQAVYAVCTACHGAQAEGNPALNAPKLAARRPGT